MRNSKALALVGLLVLIPLASMADSLPVSVTGTVPVSGSFPTPLAVQPVSGTLTVNTPAPYPTTAGTLTLKVDGSAVTQPVSGTLTVNTPPPTTTVTVTQGTGTNLHAVLDAGAASIGTIQPGNTANTTPWLTTISQGGNSVLVSGQALKTAPFMAAGIPSQAVACDQSVAVNISTATTTSLVAISGSTAVYVCSYSLNIISGTLPSFKLEYGTGAACVTTQTALTGTYGGIAGAVGQLFIQGTGLGTLMRAPASNGLCIVSGGTTPNIQGIVTFGQY